MTDRFDLAGSFPRTRRIFVCPEPDPDLPRLRTVSPVARMPGDVVRPPRDVTDVHHIGDAANMMENTSPVVEPGAAERRILAYLEERAGRWHRLIDVARALDETPRPVHAILDRAWRHGTVERQVKRAFQPVELREWKWRTSSPAVAVTGRRVR